MSNSIELKQIKKQTLKKKIVFVSGNFNIIHPGHLRLLRFARECGDYLVVGVLDNKSPGSFVDEQLRLESIQAIAWVDYSFILHEPVIAFIEKLKPAFVVKGKEHEEMDNPEKDVLSRNGGKLIFGSGEISFSSVDLMNTEWKELSVSSIKKPVDYPKRHNFSFRELAGIADKMRDLKVCVLGDTIVDEYITCDALGMSQEDPTIVVTPVAHEKFLGGAGIVALHARGLGADVHFFSVVGKDETADYAKEKLTALGVNAHLFPDESRPTTLKQRFRARQKTLLRVSHLRQHAISSEIRERFYRDMLDVLDGMDLIIFSDFNYGCLPQPLVDQVTSFCLQKGIMMVADSQSSSQVGDVSRFQGMMLVTPTEREARFAVHDFESGLVVLAEKLRKKASARNVIITLDEEGVLIHAETEKASDWLTDRLPAFNTAPKDVSGAGDSYLTCTSMSMAVGADIWKSSYIGSLASACQIGRIGNIPLTTHDLKMEINGKKVVP
ncbi:MAG: ADP-heptose synthase [Deltaproteobacteria bacterium HGW-Deltaproteobacteria-6]|jgi:rfaE bifunctional protein kinase chain/domain|nr:MAG: ADP-heptose synthase [Deltaproteobacteria bacterium HGW-Deltaproteobacteria-6]